MTFCHFVVYEVDSVGLLYYDPVDFEWEMGFLLVEGGVPRIFD